MWVKGLQEFFQLFYKFEIVSKYNVKHKATAISKMSWRPIQRALMQKEGKLYKDVL